MSKRLPIICLTAALPQDPPTELQIWAFGLVRTQKGDFTFDKDSAEAVMAAYQDNGNELCFDYNHEMIKVDGDAPAAGWFNLELRDDGLWATDIRWTPRADERLRNKEYRYFSPTFWKDGEGRPRELVNIALTNTPATKDMEPLVAASALDNRTDPTALSLSFSEITSAVSKAIYRSLGWDTYVVEIYDDSVIFEHEGKQWQIGYQMDGTLATVRGEATEVHRTYTPVDGGSMKTLLTALGLVGTATEAEGLAALNSLKDQNGQLLALTGKATLSEALGVLTAWKTGAEQVAALSAQVAELTAKQNDATVDAMIKDGQAAGKVSPAQVEFLTAMGKKDPTQLKAFLEVAPVIAPAPALKTPENPGGGAPVSLSQEQLAVAQQLGMTPEQYAAGLTAQA